MKKLLTFTMIAVIAVLVGFSSFFLTIRHENRLYFMKKDTVSLTEVYVDVTDWTIKDYVLHPEISGFLIKKNVLEHGNRIRKMIKKQLD